MEIPKQEPWCSRPSREWKLKVILELRASMLSTALPSRAPNYAPQLLSKQLPLSTSLPPANKHLCPLPGYQEGPNSGRERAWAYSGPVLIPYLLLNLYMPGRLSALLMRAPL